MNIKQLNILLADDDVDDCKFFKDALEELPLSAQLTIVNDGEQLMKILTNDINEFPDLIFLDINMPRKNGIECLSEIKSNATFKTIPVIMFSTTDKPDTIKRVFDIGTHVYVRKPGDFDQLKQLILHAIAMAGEKIQSSNMQHNQLNYILNA